MVQETIIRRLKSWEVWFENFLDVSPPFRRKLRVGFVSGIPLNLKKYYTVYILEKKNDVVVTWHNNKHFLAFYLSSFNMCVEFQGNDNISNNISTFS